MKTTVRDLIAKSELLTGRAGLGRLISSPQIVSVDLSSKGSWRDAGSSVLHIRPSQLALLSSMPPKERAHILRGILAMRPACIVVTGGEVGDDLRKAAAASKVPVLMCRNMSALTKLLVMRLAPRMSMHGVLVEVFGLGTLIIGESAIGKSEAALDLVLRGHKLAADDLVVLERTDGGVVGKATELGRDLLEIRGLGIIDIRALYGDSAVAEAAKVGLIVEMEEWKRGHHYSLVGLRERRHRILGVNIPYLKLPVKPGRNMATLIEVAARNQLLKNRGVYTARSLNKRLSERLAR